MNIVPMNDCSSYSSPGDSTLTTVVGGSTTILLPTKQVKLKFMDKNLLMQVPFE
jgi:hypothetical protein